MIRQVQTRPRQICSLWELEWLLNALAGWQEYRRNKVLQIYFSHGSVPASVISDGVMWACLPVPACPWETLDEVLLWEKKKGQRAGANMPLLLWHAEVWLGRSAAFSVIVCLIWCCTWPLVHSVICPQASIMFQVSSDAHISKCYECCSLLNKTNRD